MAEKKKKDGRGNDGRYLPNIRMKKFDEDDNNREIIGKVLNNMIVFRELGSNRVQTVDELCDRLNQFFTTCAETQQLATAEKMHLALGVPRRTVQDWRNGSTAGLGPGTKEALQMAYELIAAQDSELALQGKINPVVYIFRAKNYNGMSDKVEIDVANTTDALEVRETADVIEAKYREIPIEEGEFEE